jgi:hypothetical protein
MACAPHFFNGLLSGGVQQEDRRMLFILQAALYFARCAFIVLLAPGSDKP